MGYPILDTKTRALKMTLIDKKLLHITMNGNNNVYYDIWVLSQAFCALLNYWTILTQKTKLLNRLQLILSTTEYMNQRKGHNR